MWHDDRRAHERVELDVPAAVHSRGQTYSFTMLDLSTHGCLAEGIPLIFGVGIGVRVHARGVDLGRAEICWRDGSTAGVRFLDPLDEVAVSYLGYKPTARTLDIMTDSFGRALPGLSVRGELELCNW